MPQASRNIGLILVFGLFLPVAAFPFVLAILISFQHSNIAGFQWSFDLTAWESVFATGGFEIVLRTLWLGALVAAIATVLAVPASYILCRVGRKHGATLLALLTAPFFVDLTSRMFALRTALSHDGIIEELLSQFGVPQGTTSSWLFGNPGVLIGLLCAYACAALFPILVSMSLIPPNVLDAGRCLGCSEWHLMRRVILPLLLPGLGCGFLLCLLFCLGDFIVGSTVSGDSVMLLGSSIHGAVSAFDYPVVGVLTVILFGCMFCLLGFVMLLLRVGSTRLRLRV